MSSVHTSYEVAADDADTKTEIGKRISILVSGICISNACAGLIAAGILSGMDGSHGIAGWQWIFIVEGAATAGLAIAVL